MREFQIFAVCTSARGASPRTGPRLHSSGRRAPFADSVGKCIRGEDCLELVTSLKCCRWSEHGPDQADS